MARILFVDDEEAVRRAVRRVLGAHDVTLAGSWDEAHEALGRGGFALVISDYQLARDGRNGLDLLEEARRLVPDARRILLSGQHPPQERFPALVDFFVEKPWDNDALRALVESALR